MEGAFINCDVLFPVLFIPCSCNKLFIKMHPAFYPLKSYLFPCHSELWGRDCRSTARMVSLGCWGIPPPPHRDDRCVVKRRKTISLMISVSSWRLFYTCVVSFADINGTFIGSVSQLNCSLMCSASTRADFHEIGSTSRRVSWSPRLH